MYEEEFSQRLAQLRINKGIPDISTLLKTEKPFQL